SGVRQPQEPSLLFERLLNSKFALLVLLGHGDVGWEEEGEELRTFLSPLANEAGAELHMIRLLNDTVFVFLFHSSVSMDAVREALKQWRKLQEEAWSERTVRRPLMGWSEAIRSAGGLRDHYLQLSRMLKLQFFN